jgi:multidrug resistance protein, MATE family
VEIDPRAQVVAWTEAAANLPQPMRAAEGAVRCFCDGLAIQPSPPMDAPNLTAPLQQARSFGGEVRELLRLAGPIAFVQLGMTAMGFVDVAFLGHYGAESLSSMGLGNTLTWAAIVFCMGAIAAVDPLLSQAVGAKDRPAVTLALVRGLLLATALAIPAIAALLPAATWLLAAGQPESLVDDAALYARINTAGILPMLWFSVLRSLHSAHSDTKGQVIAILVGNACNVLLDWMLIYGRLGCPELGVAGAAWATVASRWVLLLSLAWMSRHELREHAHLLREPALRSAAFAFAPVARLLRLGLPIGGQYAMEMGVFAATALLIGDLDAQSGETEGLRLCGHQIAIQLASLSFMVPLGVGIAGSVRVGWAIGRGEPLAARRTALAALCCGAIVMSAFMLLFLLAPEFLASVLASDPRAVAWGAALLPIAGVFQIGDGLQVTAIGLLRGAGDVRSPFWINLVGYWAIALPLGCWLAFPWGKGLGPQGLWWGLVAGLFAVAAALLLVVRVRFGEVRGRLSVE